MKYLDKDGKIKFKDVTGKKDGEAPTAKKYINLSGIAVDRELQRKQAGKAGAKEHT